MAAVARASRSFCSRALTSATASSTGVAAAALRENALAQRREGLGRKRMLGNAGDGQQHRHHAGAADKGKIGKTCGGGMNIRFPGGRKSDSLWGCCLPQTLTGFRTPL